MVPESLGFSAKKRKSVPRILERARGSSPLMARLSTVSCRRVAFSGTLSVPENRLFLKPHQVHCRAQGLCIADARNPFWLGSGFRLR